MRVSRGWAHLIGYPFGDGIDRVVEWSLPVRESSAVRAELKGAAAWSSRTSRWGDLARRRHPTARPRCLSSGGCATSGDEDTIEGKVDAFVNDVVDELPSTPPPCGLANEWGSQAFDDGQFAVVLDVAVNGSGEVFVSDVFHGIQKFTYDGSFLTKFAGTLGNVLGIAVDESGNVFAAGGNAGAILQYTSTGDFLTSRGGIGTGDGQFQFEVIKRDSERACVT